MNVTVGQIKSRKIKNLPKKLRTKKKQSGVCKQFHLDVAEFKELNDTVLRKQCPDFFIKSPCIALQRIDCVSNKSQNLNIVTGPDTGIQNMVVCKNSGSLHSKSLSFEDLKEHFASKHANHSFPATTKESDIAKQQQSSNIESQEHNNTPNISINIVTELDVSKLKLTFKNLIYHRSSATSVDDNTSHEQSNGKLLHSPLECDSPIQHFITDNDSKSDLKAFPNLSNVTDDLNPEIDTLSHRNGNSNVKRGLSNKTGDNCSELRKLNVDGDSGDTTDSHNSNSLTSPTETVDTEIKDFNSDLPVLAEVAPEGNSSFVTRSLVNALPPVLIPERNLPFAAGEGIPINCEKTIESSSTVHDFNIESNEKDIILAVDKTEDNTVKSFTETNEKIKYDLNIVQKHVDDSSFKQLKEHSQRISKVGESVLCNTDNKRKDYDFDIDEKSVPRTHSEKVRNKILSKKVLSYNDSKPLHQHDGYDSDATMIYDDDDERNEYKSLFGAGTELVPLHIKHQQLLRLKSKVSISTTDQSDILKTPETSEFIDSLYPSFRGENLDKSEDLSSSKASDMEDNVLYIADSTNVYSPTNDQEDLLTNQEDILTKKKQDAEKDKINAPLNSINISLKQNKSIFKGPKCKRDNKNSFSIKLSASKWEQAITSGDKVVLADMTISHGVSKRHLKSKRNASALSSGKKKENEKRKRRDSQDMVLKNINKIFPKPRRKRPKDEDDLPTILPPKRRRQSKINNMTSDLKTDIDRIKHEFPHFNWLEKKYSDHENTGDTNSHSNDKSDGKQLHIEATQELRTDVDSHSEEQTAEEDIGTEEKTAEVDIGTEEKTAAVDTQDEENLNLNNEEVLDNVTKSNEAVGVASIPEVQEIIEDKVMQDVSPVTAETTLVIENKTEIDTDQSLGILEHCETEVSNANEMDYSSVSNTSTQSIRVMGEVISESINNLPNIGSTTQESTNKNDNGKFENFQQSIESGSTVERLACNTSNVKDINDSKMCGNKNVSLTTLESSTVSRLLNSSPKLSPIWSSIHSSCANTPYNNLPITSANVVPSETNRMHILSTNSFDDLSALTGHSGSIQTPTTAVISEYTENTPPVIVLVSSAGHPPPSSCCSNSINTISSKVDVVYSTALNTLQSKINPEPALQRKNVDDSVQMSKIWDIPPLVPTPPKQTKLHKTKLFDPQIDATYNEIKRMKQELEIRNRETCQMMARLKEKEDLLRNMLLSSPLAQSNCQSSAPVVVCEAISRSSNVVLESFSSGSVKTNQNERLPSLTGVIKSPPPAHLCKRDNTKQILKTLEANPITIPPDIKASCPFISRRRPLSPPSRFKSEGLNGPVPIAHGQKPFDVSEKMLHTKNERSKSQGNEGNYPLETNTNRATSAPAHTNYIGSPLNLQQNTGRPGTICSLPNSADKTNEPSNIRNSEISNLSLNASDDFSNIRPQIIIDSSHIIDTNNQVMNPTRLTQSSPITTKSTNNTESAIQHELNEAVKRRQKQEQRYEHQDYQQFKISKPQSIQVPNNAHRLKMIPTDIPESVSVVQSQPSSRMPNSSTDAMIMNRPSSQSMVKSGQPSPGYHGDLIHVLQRSSQSTNQPNCPSFVRTNTSLPHSVRLIGAATVSSNNVNRLLGQNRFPLNPIYRQNEQHQPVPEAVSRVQLYGVPHPGVGVDMPHASPLLPSPKGQKEVGEKKFPLQMPISAQQHFHAPTAHPVIQRQMLSPQLNSQAHSTVQHLSQGHSTAQTIIQAPTAAQEISVIQTQGQGSSRPGQHQVKVLSQDSSNKTQNIFGSCILCGKFSLYLCSTCQNIWYCSQQCQLKHWTTHQHECKFNTSK